MFKSMKEREKNMTEVYLGNPPQHVIDWIINH